MKIETLFTNEIDYDFYKDDYKNYCEDMEIEYDECEVYEWAIDCIKDFLSDFRWNIKNNDMFKGKWQVEGNVGRWDERHEIVPQTFKTLEMAVDKIIPDYEATFTFTLNDDGSITYAESSHDCPTGGTMLTLRKIED